MLSDATNVARIPTVQPLVHLHPSACITHSDALTLYLISRVKWVARWSQGRANSPMLAAMTVKTTWSDSNQSISPRGAPQWCLEAPRHSLSVHADKNGTVLPLLFPLSVICAAIVRSSESPPPPHRLRIPSPRLALPLISVVVIGSDKPWGPSERLRSLVGIRCYKAYTHSSRHDGGREGGAHGHTHTHTLIHCRTNTYS